MHWIQAGPGEKRSFFSDFFSLAVFSRLNELFIWQERDFFALSSDQKTPAKKTVFKTGEDKKEKDRRNFRT